MLTQNFEQSPIGKLLIIFNLLLDTLSFRTPIRNLKTLNAWIPYLP
jgi:hypothetical protein